MPELPEVETTVRGLARFLEGERIVAARTNRPDMRRPFPADLVQGLTGATVTGLSRRAKYGLVHTDRDRTMVFHLGMSGRWRIDPETDDKHDHFVIETADHRFALCDPRRFGWVDLVDTGALGQWPGFATMGPEPLGPDLTVGHLATVLAGRKQAIKLCLLDQKIVAGLGNIYVSEILYRAGIDPRRHAGRISAERIAMLVPLTAAKTALAATVAMPRPPRKKRNSCPATSKVSRPMPAMPTSRPMTTKSGMVPNE